LASLLTNNLESWLRDLPPGCTVVPHHAEPAAPRKGESAFDAVERLRRRLEELRADLRQVGCAPITSAEAKAKVRAEVEALAARGPDVYGVIERRHGGVDWPTTLARVDAFRDGRADPDKPLVRVFDSLGLLAWLAKDPLISAIEAEIDRRADDAAALTEEQRASRVADIRQELLAVERDEESLITLLNRTGGDIARRPDADARAVLGVEIATPAADERAPTEAMA
jgi:hypothetical protein